MSLLTLVLVFSVAFGVAFTSECPTYWTWYNGYCYRVFGTPTTWHNAEGQCLSSCSGKTPHLVSIHSTGENEYLKTLLATTHGANFRYWIGLNDLLRPGQYRWSDASVNDYQGWLSGEPNGASEHCVEYWKSSRVGWNDAPCGNVKGYVCKMPK